MKHRVSGDIANMMTNHENMVLSNNTKSNYQMEEEKEDWEMWGHIGLWPKFSLGHKQNPQFSVVSVVHKESEGQDW
jgi:hypothetical protein